MVAFSVAVKVSSLLLICIILPVQGQVPPSPKKFAAANEDVPFISCSVCGKALKHIKQQVNELRNEVSRKGKKVEEDDILNIVEASCDPDKKQGDWITRYDIIGTDNGLKIMEQETQSRCRQECKTISKACTDSIGDADTDIGELLWKDELSLSKLINKVCYEMTGACTKKIPKFVKGKRKDEIFKPMSDDERKAFDAMKQMKSVPGMPGMEMYSREELAQMREQLTDSQDTGKIDEKKHQASQQIPVAEQTKLGFIDAVKATFSSLYNSFRKLFSFGNKKSEL